MGMSGYRSRNGTGTIERGSSVGLGTVSGFVALNFRRDNAPQNAFLACHPMPVAAVTGEPSLRDGPWLERVVEAHHSTEIGIVAHDDRRQRVGVDPVETLLRVHPGSVVVREEPVTLEPTRC